MLEILEHPSPQYKPRTLLNASTANLTVALAMDYNTAGEKLTRTAAGNNYLALPLYGETQDPIVAARRLYKTLRDRNIQNPVINVAGNGIYSLGEEGWSQDIANLHLLIMLTKVHQHWPILKIITGGQTGIDLAGAVAACCLKIEATMTLPKGLIQRGLDKKDRQHTEEEIREQVSEGMAFIAESIREHKRAKEIQKTL